MDSTSLNKSLCRTFFEELHNKQNLEIIDRLVDPNVVSHDPFPNQAEGSKGFRDTMQLFRSAFPDMSAKINDMIAENDKVMTKLTVYGTHLGEFMGIGPTKNKIEYEEVIILRIADGKIVEHWAVADALSLMQQVGAIPSN